MAQLWDADVELDEEISRRLIETQFPELAPARLENLGEGWDNLAWRVNGEFVFRIPRRQMGADLIEIEARILPLLAPQLDVEIPVPQFMGEPAGDYPYSFLGYRHIAGTTGCTSTLATESLIDLAPDIAKFLARLHAVSLGSEFDEAAPGDEVGRTDLARRARILLERFDDLRSEIPHVDAESFHAWVNELALTPGWQAEPCWVHGDLYARHLVLDDEQRLCGVIDWGDVHRSDPALDLGIAWSFLPSEAHAVFREHYGPIDDDTWLRARFVSIHYAMALLNYGVDVADRALEAVGRRALEYGLAGSGVKVR